MRLRGVRAARPAAAAVPARPPAGLPASDRRFRGGGGGSGVGARDAGGEWLGRRVPAPRQRRPPGREKALPAPLQRRPLQTRRRARASREGTKRRPPRKRSARSLEGNRLRARPGRREWEEEAAAGDGQSSRGRARQPEPSLGGAGAAPPAGRGSARERGGGGLSDGRRSRGAGARALARVRRPRPLSLTPPGIAPRSACYGPILSPLFFLTLGDQNRIYWPEQHNVGIWVDEPLNGKKGGC